MIAVACFVLQRARSRFKMELLRRTVLLSAFLCAVRAFSSGPPDIMDTRNAPAMYMGLTRGELVCERLTPGHFDGFVGVNSPTPIPQEGNGGYFIISDLIDDLNGQYTAEESYSLQLTGTTNGIRGLLVQARDDSGTLIGTFTPMDTSKSQTLNCNLASPQATVTHRIPDIVTFQNYTWQAPPNNGTVTFSYTVVQAADTYFVAINSSAAMNRPSEELPTTEPPTDSVIPVFTVPPEAPTTAPEDYNVRFRSPLGCNVSSCDYYMGIQINENNTFLDFYLEADADGWVAVGFSGSNNMFDADVVGCQLLESENMVFAVNTWNPSTRTNQFDPNQDGMFLHSGSFENGRIFCNFSRFAGVVNPGVDLDLNGNWYFMFGVGDDAARDNRSAFSQHQVTPTRSADRHCPNTMEDIEMEEDTLQPSGELPTTEPPTDFVIPAFTDPPEAPTTAPEDYNVRFRSPLGCSVSSCDYYMGIQMNENNTFLDFYLEADADGWVAVGFSGSNNMFDADVVGCQVLESENIVFAVNTWNPSPSTRTNRFDPNQDGMFLHFGFFENGRIFCTFSRFVGVVNPGEDLDLNGNWYFMFGVGDDAARDNMSGFSQHQVTPTRSANRHHPNTTEDIEIEDTLIRGHGVLMIAAWPMLTVTAFLSLFFVYVN